MLKLFCCILIAALSGFQAGAQGASGQSAEVDARLSRAEGGGPDAITPAHVYGLVTVVLGEIDLIRLEMGKPGVDPPPIQVENAGSREVFFQALTLFRKANQLAFEHLRDRVREPSIPFGTIESADVYEMVQGALERVREVRDVLGISERSDEPALDPASDSSRVFNAIVLANRQLNSLLDQRFSPTQVYEQVTTAIAYMARLLDSRDEVSTPPPPPPFERRKRPADVYRKLVECFDLIREIGDRSGVHMLNLGVNDDQVSSVEPSDVYDIASLLVSELTHLHSQRVGSAPPRKVYNPGRKIPSDVYQRIGVLFIQAETLLRRVNEDPDWLRE